MRTTSEGVLVLCRKCDAILLLSSCGFLTMSCRPTPFVFHWEWIHGFVKAGFGRIRSTKGEREKKVEADRGLWKLGTPQKGRSWPPLTWPITTECPPSFLPFKRKRTKRGKRACIDYEERRSWPLTIVLKFLSVSFLITSYRPPPPQVVGNMSHKLKARVGLIQSTNEP
jgi:hypothetical protein